MLSPQFPTTIVAALSRSPSLSASSPFPSCLSWRLSIGIASSKRAYCSLRLPEVSAGHLELPSHPILPDNSLHEQRTRPIALPSEPSLIQQDPELNRGDTNVDEEISGIQVPRQKYIPVSKSELADAIVSKMFKSRADVHHFILLSSCVDSILHAEHKCVLEEMRTDYFLNQDVKNDGTVNEILPNFERKFAASGSVRTRGHTTDVGSIESYGIDVIDRDKRIPFDNGVDSLVLPVPQKRRSPRDSRVSSATRFQRAFMKLLDDAQFEELSARDLMLTSVLNTDYLLTLPIYVDWKKASQSNAIIFRRGYATEQQKGVLIVEKLDYIQAKLLQRIFSIIEKPLMKVIKSAFQTQEMRIQKRIESWLKQLPFFKKAYMYSEQISPDNTVKTDEISEDDLPMWLAAQRAITRYEGFLSSIGPRGRLLRRFLSWVGLVPSTLDPSFELRSDHVASEPHRRPIFLPKISLRDIWRPVTEKGNNVWELLKKSISTVFSQSVLQEPAFQELILLYTEEVTHKEVKVEEEVPVLRLKIYEKIPIPDLPVIFPHKKLSFRILDTIRLDIATLLGLLAFFVNNHFVNILSSPSALLLDTIATSALVLFVTRVVLGYKQTGDRYKLLVNSTLYEKTISSGFGSVHFLLDASEQQQYKEAILAYAILLTMEKSQASCQRSIGDKCERFMYEVFQVKVEMAIEKAVNTLRRLGLVTKWECDGEIMLKAVPYHVANEALIRRWNHLLHSHCFEK